jgi:hypothetical protein
MTPNGPAPGRPKPAPILGVAARGRHDADPAGRGPVDRLPSGGDPPPRCATCPSPVGRGEIVCLVGESGSGKSVIAQGVMGLLPKQLPVTAGRILLQGEDITHAPLSRLRELRARACR